MKHKIVLVPFPFDDFTGVKVRPVVCLTNRITGYNHIVIAFVTSQISKAVEPSDLLIKNTDPNFKVTGFKVSSAVRLHRLVTIPTKIIRRQLGDLPSDYHADLESKLKTLFGL
ncbi:MAG TPA: type II toxin-antitoxin system PemK/MazF family toxin [Phaeodactylibacter sp.]|nr:type II toxin-antitoxin system PemK/MazF family toxin [Phaeodactylibacter sp.]